MNKRMIGYKLQMVLQVMAIVPVLTNREFHLSTKYMRIPNQKPFHREEVDTLVACVYKCTILVDCESVVFIKSSSTCELCGEDQGVKQQEQNAESVQAVLIRQTSNRAQSIPTKEETPENPKTHDNFTSTTRTAIKQEAKHTDIMKKTEITPGFTVGTYHKLPKGKDKRKLPFSSNKALITTTSVPTTSKKYDFVLMEERITWKSAERSCNDTGMRIAIINSYEKQAEAVEVIKQSDLKIVAIGALKDTFKWRYANLEILKYKNWAPSEPLFFGFFCAISREEDYKWVTLKKKADGYLCEYL